MAAPKRRAARAGFIRSDDVEGLVHVPDLMVPDHDDEFRIGFLHHRFRKDEAQPEPLPQPNPAWRAPAKFERRR